MINVELTKEQTVELIALLGEQITNLYNQAEKFQNEQLQNHFVKRADVLFDIKRKIFNEFMES